MNIMMIIINTISICYVMLRNKPLFSYFYLNKNNTNIYDQWMNLLILLIVSMAKISL